MINAPVVQWLEPLLVAKISAFQAEDLGSNPSRRIQPLYFTLFLGLLFLNKIYKLLFAFLFLVLNLEKREIEKTFIFMVLLVLFVAGFFVLKNYTGFVSAYDVDFSIHRIKDLRIIKGETRTLSFNGITGHVIRLKDVTSNSATLMITSNPVTITLEVGETVTVDYNKDVYMDMEITLKSVLGASVVEIRIKKLLGADKVAEEDTWLEKQEFSLSKEKISVSVTQGETVRESFWIRNEGPEDLYLILEVEGLEDYILLSDKFVILDQIKEKAMYINFVALAEQEPKTYTGRVIVKTARIKKEILIVMEVKQREALFDVSVEIPEEFKEVFPGGKVLAEINLFNIGKIGMVDTVVTYYIKDPSSNLIIQEHETVGVETKVGFTKSFVIPRTAMLGAYTCWVRLRYGGASATGEATFLVEGEGRKLVKYWKETIIVLVIIAVLILIFFFFFL